ncbi:phosphatase PAP2 family protein [Frankia sp. CNm7]|uniref:Phosphatase PAP2 family protein n=1 Tax=Frankia nepalensis TaxID=1836974 RepID=A0A937RNX6_9ACTN|nr:phosphatase PAP2 family protein [Frankia nepalensis]MBL7511231.1 phosphatase PAP2 family protein [Frankia nepalensis]MBL7523210.1 phosphatase PAP2 family protein [Frankia nepalensis]MBL7632335.1 phosphatase PAP2 family protein [Frankia nepalensis]
MIVVRLVVVAALLIGVFTALGTLIASGPAAVRDADLDVVRWFAAHRTGWLLRATAAGTYLSDTWTVIAATALLAAAAGWWTRRWLLPAAAVLLTAGETAIYELTGLLVDRPRPPVPRLDVGDPAAGYPSGHVAAAVCLYGGVAVFARWAAARRRAAAGVPPARGVVDVVAAAAAAAAVLAPLVVAFCRVYRGMHHPTDVLAGALIGACWLAAVARVLLRPALAAVDDRRPRPAPPPKATAMS